MSEMHQTRCPHCSSVFKVSPDQLQAKNGMVRCGACLQVFRADLNLLGFGNTETTPVTAAPAPAPPKKRGVGKDDDWAEKLLQSESTASTGQGGELRLTSTVTPIDDMARYGTAEHDDWKQQLAQPADNNTRISLGESELSDFMLEKSSAHHPSADHPFMAATMKDNSIPSNADEAWAQDILNELARVDSQPQHPLAKLQNAPLTPPPQTATDNKDHFAFGDEEALDFLNDNDLDVQTPIVNSNQPALDFTSPLANISEPVTIATPSKAWPWERLLLWGALNSLAILLLVGQVVYFHPGMGNQLPWLSPYIARFCETLHCRAVAPDNNSLRIDMLIVRPDSDHGRILIDTLLHNDSNSDYPLPRLRLTMRDRDGNVLGTRLLSPADYLGNAMTSLPTLPPHTPVHISLTVRDPGQPIVSTSLNVQPSADTGSGS